MSAPGSIGWFAPHEARLAWRDWLLADDRRASPARPAPWCSASSSSHLFLHGLAYLMLSRSTTLAGSGDTRTLVVIAGTLVLTLSLMLSQAMESVTRAFYARGDLELILTSPAAASRLFAVRICRDGGDDLSRCRC